MGKGKENTTLDVALTSGSTISFFQCHSQPFFFSSGRSYFLGWPIFKEDQLLFDISRIFSFMSNSLIRSTSSELKLSTESPGTRMKRDEHVVLF